MSMKKEDYEEFQRQLELQKHVEETKPKEKTKVDEDGTEYEWDSAKKAWFPKLTDDLILKYQANYETATTDTSKKETYYDPLRKLTYSWDTTKKEWIPVAKSQVSDKNNSNPYEYKDPTTGNMYYWNTAENKWSADPSDAKTNASASTSYTDPQSGIVYEWNAEKYLWVAEDGSVLYPSNESNTQSATGEEKEDYDAGKSSKNNKRKLKGPMSIGGKKSKAEWFSLEKEKNTSLYVSGLPPDITLLEFTELMQKYGIIQTNPITNELKIKLYYDREGNLKGDGLCSYLKRESLDLVMNLLHDTKIRSNYKVKIQEAQFELKGNYDPTKKPKMLTKKEKKKLQKQTAKKLDWKLGSAETKISKADRVVIFKNMFDSKEFDENPLLITEIRDDLRTKCEEFGPVKKVIIFDRHTDGVCSVAFKEVEPAQDCIKSLNGRYFGGLIVEAFHWDGNTNYQIEETDREREERLKNWDKFLTSESDKNADTEKISLEEEKSSLVTENISLEEEKSSLDTENISDT